MYWKFLLTFIAIPVVNRDNGATWDIATCSISGVKVLQKMGQCGKYLLDFTKPEGEGDLSSMHQLGQICLGTKVKCDQMHSVQHGKSVENYMEYNTFIFSFGKETTVMVDFIAICSKY